MRISEDIQHTARFVSVFVRVHEGDGKAGLREAEASDFVRFFVRANVRGGI
jgi:hypothetical protein